MQLSSGKRSWPLAKEQERIKVFELKHLLRSITLYVHKLMSHFKWSSYLPLATPNSVLYQSSFSFEYIKLTVPLLYLSFVHCPWTSDSQLFRNCTGKSWPGYLISQQHSVLRAAPPSCWFLWHFSFWVPPTSLMIPSYNPSKSVVSYCSVPTQRLSPKCPEQQLKTIKP